MKKHITLAAVAAATFATGAGAHHAENLNVPFSTRGACEAENSALSNEDGWLLDAFPSLFSSEGEVRSFLNRAFKCEPNQSDGNFYITDHRAEVIASDWFQRRLP
jgi:hypothetical protein